jgi:hypothetical protein
MIWAVQISKNRFRSADADCVSLTTLRVTNPRFRGALKNLRMGCASVGGNYSPFNLPESIGRTRMQDLKNIAFMKQ